MIVVIRVGDGEPVSLLVDRSATSWTSTTTPFEPPPDTLARPRPASSSAAPTSSTDRLLLALDVDRAVAV